MGENIIDKMYAEINLELYEVMYYSYQDMLSIIQHMDKTIANQRNPLKRWKLMRERRNMYELAHERASRLDEMLVNS